MFTEHWTVFSAALQTVSHCIQQLEVPGGCNDGHDDVEDAGIDDAGGDGNDEDGGIADDDDALSASHD